MKIIAILFAALIAHAAEMPSWMQGSWRAESHGTRMEEHWTSAGAGVMLRIEQKDGSLVYLAMPSGRPATPFPLKSITAGKVIFENLRHDFPQRIIYWRDGKKLCGRVEGTIGGKEESEECCWSRF